MFWQRFLKPTPITPIPESIELSVLKPKVFSPPQEKRHSILPRPYFTPSHPHRYLLADLANAQQVIRNIYKENLIESQPTVHDEERAVAEVLNLQLRLINMVARVESHLRHPLRPRRHLDANDMFGRFEEKLDEVPAKVRNLIARVTWLEKALWRGATLAVLEGKKCRVDTSVEEKAYRQVTVEALVGNGLLVRGILDRFGRPMEEFREICERCMRRDSGKAGV